MLFGNLVHFAAGILRFCHGEVGPVPYAGRGGISYAGVKWGGVLGGGRLSPQFHTKVAFCVFLSTVRARPGSPHSSEPHCPPNAVENLSISKYHFYILPQACA